MTELDGQILAHGQSWGNDELTESFRVNHALRESIEKALQLFVAPTLAMSRILTESLQLNGR